MLLTKHLFLQCEEKVGDVEKPVTPATKRAVRECKRTGVARYAAPTLIRLCRKTSVQVSAPLLKGLRVSLKSVEDDQWCERRRARRRASIGEKLWRAQEKTRLAK